jgi:hypothetical protein
MEAGRLVGCTTALIDFSYDEPVPVAPDYVVHSVSEAGDVIIETAARTIHLDGPRPRCLDCAVGPNAAAEAAVSDRQGFINQSIGSVKTAAERKCSRRQPYPLGLMGIAKGR